MLSNAAMSVTPRCPINHETRISPNNNVLRGKLNCRARVRRRSCTEITRKEDDTCEARGEGALGDDSILGRGARDARLPHRDKILCIPASRPAGPNGRPAAFSPRGSRARPIASPPRISQNGNSPAPPTDELI